ncbi:MAG: hypothetical protein L3J08_06710 [Flavobacteriaceae bacterium]|nr:hypothetical protein [Flavobacteriaceae bacterium]
MFGIFKKKPITIEEHFDLLVNKPKKLFQIDIIRNSQVDFQITRQKLLLGWLKLPISNSEGFAISLTFNSEKNNNAIYFKKFKESDLYNKELKIELGGDTFFIYCDNNYEAISKLINRIMFEVYNYKKDEVYQFSYIEH